jgi:DNA polymerase III subunit gamma/tau
VARKQLNETKQEPVKYDEPLHIKHRPKDFDEVVGQGDVVKSLKKVLTEKVRPHTFLFVGDSGCGKTTLARIVTSKLNIDPSNIIEVDAATNNGIDVMRDLISPLRYQGFGDTPNKAIILDEAHALSKQAWTSLLKTVEEPPAHVFFFFCTTDSGKVPDNIATRCLRYTLRPCKYDDLMDLLDKVCEEEQYDTPERILSLVARSCNGSPRLALVQLAMVHDCEDEDEAARLLETPVDNKEVIDLCRMLIKGDLTWTKLTTTLKGLSEMPAESIRIVIVNYLNSCAMGAKSDKDAMRVLDMLECFSKPCLTSDKLAPLLIAFGRYIYD